MVDKKLNEFEEIFGGLSNSCEACGGKVTPQKVNLEEFENGKLYLMEQVPALVCENCGEMWIPEQIIEEFEKMIETAKKRKSTAKKKKPRKREAK